MSDPLVKVEDLVVAYGKTPVLRGVSLEIEEGETLGLVGGSGSGKSTLARAVLALLRVRPRSGRVLYRGQDVYRLSRAELQSFRRDAQIVFQDPDASLNPRMSVGAALREVLRVHPLPDQRSYAVDQLLEQVGVDPGAADRFPHAFSGGQRQRISIARALAVWPRFLALDEPLSALDVSVAAQILHLLEDLRASRQLTYLLITHDLAVVEQVADRVAVMHDGEIIETGPTPEVFDRPRHPYTKSLLRAIPQALRHP